VDAWALGPGVAVEAPDQLERIRRALKWARSERVPTVLDAGGFTELKPGERLDPWIVLTPHAGELATLLADRGVPVERSAIEAQPVRYAQMGAELLGGTLLLKGPATVVAGQSDSVYVQADGTPWLATAGTGDVLTGLIGVLLAGHGPSVAISPEVPLQIAATAALVHGRAATIASGHAQVGGRTIGGIGSPVAAFDVIDALPGTIGQLLSR
jgi:NAD(P)H-hydrate repair Nnr-like enzyme with NAD(P)H-hydrate dehydratase domain